MHENPRGGGRFIASAQNIRAMLEDGDVLRMIRRRMGLGDTLGVLPPECGGTGTTEGVDIGKAYPVGSVYMSVVDADPSTLFGGVWERIEGRFLLAADSAHAAGSTGGEAEHRLTVDEMPSHTHGMECYSQWSSAGAYMGAVRSHTYKTDVSTKSAGGGKPHNNMPPYLAVYMWKRTA